MEGENKKFDKWGYQVRTTSNSYISAINAYHEQVLSYGRKRSVILEAPKCDPNCVLGNILADQYLRLPGRSLKYMNAAEKYLEFACPYEKALFPIVKNYISEDREDNVAMRLHFELLKEFPKDLVSLKIAQLLCFYMGRPDLSLRLVEQVLPHVNEKEDYVYGMQAFPLLEVGRIEEAKKAGQKRFEINKNDPWSQHVLCHAYQYECRFKKAATFMEECSKSYSLSSFMYTHNWWHVALCYLEGRAPIEKVRDIYDDCIFKELEKCGAKPAEVYLNALGLLIRVYVQGKHDSLEDRLEILANKLEANEARDFWFREWHLDVLILWALSSMGKLSKAKELLDGLKMRISKVSKEKQHSIKQCVSEALYNFGKGDNKQALKLLGDEFDAVDYKIIGASVEQLDVFTEIHINLLLDILKSSWRKRGNLPYLWNLREQAHSMLAREYGQKARDLEAAQNWDENFNPCKKIQK
ncbi:hypothetical protein ACJIZ3_009117 [Penstemon smallii]|uniref:Tetratricopeptide repeat protein 38 n=1 Tax=Penstemon smallii TaxID=265156 RepID=A0ABD3TBM9_9LAMI